MKAFLFSLLPTWLKNYKHADKIAHVIYGVLLYLVLSLFLPSEFALFLVWLVALAVEIYDGYTHRPDVKDFIITVVFPTIIYIFTK